MSDADPRAFRIVVSYRRVDTGGDARALAEALAERFGEENVFFDIHAIGPGEPFDQVIAKAVAASDVFVACVGQHWLTVAAADGSRRLDDSEDYVRRELEGALASDVLVIPVTLEGAEMPSADDLPPSLAPFATRNAVDLRATSWHSDVRTFVDKLAVLKREKRRRGRKGIGALFSGAFRDTVDWAWHNGRRRRGVVLTSVVVALALVLGGLALRQILDGDDGTRQVTPPAAAATASEATLAYSSGSRIFLVGADGRSRPLPGEPLRKEPDWSPDGTLLAYSQAGDIWTSNPEGGETVQVTTGPDEDGSPAWSPSGDQIAFSRTTGDGPSRIWIVGSTGDDPFEFREGAAPDWSPTGRRLVYQRAFAIWITEIDKPDEQNLTEDYDRAALFPAWSPDGTRIAFILPDPRDKATGCKLVIVKPNGAERRDHLLDRPLKCRDTSWSPDGQRIVFAGGEEGIFTVKRNGEGLERIVDAPGAVSPSARPRPDA